jgi:hypothetical protein
MWKVIETAILWALLPFGFVGLLAALLNAPWTVLGIIVAVPAVPALCGAAYGFFTAWADHSGATAKRKAAEANRERALVHQALLPGRPDDVQG